MDWNGFLASVHRWPSSRMRRRPRRGSAPFACLVATAAVSMAGCGGGASRPPEQLPPEVGVANVVSRSVRAWDEFNGRVTAIQEVQLRPRVSGYIDRVAYREGDEVRAGDLLFVIDPRPYHDVLDSAVAQL